MAYTVSGDDNVAELAKKCPRAIELLSEYGLACANCFLNQFDTVEGGAKLHGMTDEEVGIMIDEINGQLANEG